MPDTGNGATMTFATSGFTACFNEVDAGEDTIEAIDDTCLDSTGQRTFIPGDLRDPGEITGIFQWEATESLPPLGVPETVTITFPLNTIATPPHVTAATLAGTGFITRRKRPVMRNNEIMQGEVTIKWDGKTGPTYTPATT